MGRWLWRRGGGCGGKEAAVEEVEGEGGVGGEAVEGRGGGDGGGVRGGGGEGGGWEGGGGRNKAPIFELLFPTSKVK